MSSRIAAFAFTVTASLTLSTFATAQPALDGLRIRRDVDGIAGAMDQLIGERQPPTDIRDPPREVLAPRQSCGR